MTAPVRLHKDGLSPSSMALFQQCQRKYFFKKVAGVQVDSDVTDDVEALMVGKCLHKILEDCRHKLDGLSYESVKAATLAHDLGEETAPMIFAMAKAYKISHEKSGLRAIGFEVPIDTESFFGIADVILTDLEGNWWIGDLKTSAAYNPAIVPTFARHPQLSLYAANAEVIAKELNLDVSKFMGVRYRMVTKSKLIRKSSESLEGYIDRLGSSVKSLDFAIPKEMLSPKEVVEVHSTIREKIKSKEESDYLRNHSNCMLYFRPCEYFSKCNGCNYSSFPKLEVFTSGDE